MKPGAWRNPNTVKWIGMGACAALLLLFAILSYTAVAGGFGQPGKSATYDEPLHALGGFVHRVAGDFRINPEDPPLFGWWGSLIHSRDALKLKPESYYWTRMLDDFSTNQWYYLWNILYRTEGNDGDAFIQTSRFMFTLVGVMLGALIAWWSWRIAGVAAAVVAAAFFALDPNFLAHASLVKNDVMLSLAMAGLAMAIWSFGRRGSWPALAGIVIAAAAAVNIKFSGVLCGPIIFIALVVRALIPQNWNVIGLELNVWWKRLIVVPAVCFLVAVVGFIAIWACYGFRFAPTSDPQGLFNTEYLVQRARQNRLRARLPQETDLNRITKTEIDAEPTGSLVDAVVWATNRRLLPQAWLHGFLYTYVSTLVRSSYLLGEVRITGWWYYFPAAMLFKTPTATLAAVACAGAILFVGMVFRGSRGRAASRSADAAPAETAAIDWWTVTCLALPVLIYAGSAMTTNLNLGLRHVLPLYPFFFIAIAVMLAGLIRRLPALGRTVAGVLILGLAAESLPAYPNYIPFFNTPSGGAVGGIRLLGDSNLDWGQDLKLLAQWQQSHRDRPLFLAYFGIADPWFHKVNAIPVPPQMSGWPFATETQVPHGRCYFAVSATNLQTIYLGDPQVVELYDRFRNAPAEAILGGSIYIYALPEALQSRTEVRPETAP